MKRRALLILAVMVGIAPAVAKSTKLIFTWLNPKYSGTHFKNIMVLGINGRASVRAQFEDQLCAGIARPGIQCSPSYSLIPRPTGTPLDMNDLRDVVSGQNIDAIVASRLVKIDKTVNLHSRPSLSSVSRLRHVLRLLRRDLSGGLFARLSSRGQNGAGGD